MNLLSIILPVHHEHSRLADIIERVLKIEPELVQVGLSGLELLIVADGTSAEIDRIVADYADQDVRLISHGANRRYGSALKVGFHCAKGNYLAFMSADYTANPDDYPRMFTALRTYSADLAIGSRFAGSRTDSSFIQRIGSNSFAALMSAIADKRITNSASSLYLLRRKALETLYPLPDGSGFPSAMIAHALHEDIKMVEVPLSSEQLSGSKRRAARDNFRFLISVLGAVAIYNPARLLGTLAMGAIGLATLAILPWLIATSSGVEDRGGHAVLLFVAMTLTIVAVNLFSIGILFNTVVSLFQRRSCGHKLLESRFALLGMGLLLAGLFLFGTAVSSPPSPEPTWFLLVPSALFVMTGVQLEAGCLLVYALRKLSQREAGAQEDLGVYSDPLENDTIMLSAKRQEGAGVV